MAVVRGPLLFTVAVWFGSMVWAAPIRAQAADDRAREEEWRKLFMEGIAAYDRGDEDGAIEKWETANRVYDLRPEGYNNIAVIFGERGDYERAAAMYRQALSVLPRMRAPLESESIERLGARRDVYQGLLGSADELFRQGDAAGAAEALTALTAADPNNGEAWYILGLALNKLGRWGELVPVARRALELAPLNASARAMLVTASKSAGIGSELTAPPAPVSLEDVQMFRSPKGLTLRGTVVAAAAPPGTAVRIEATFDDAGEMVGSHPITITAPAKGQRTQFSSTMETSAIATSYRYRLLD